MKVTLIQIDIIWCESMENRSVIENFMRNNKGSDLYVLPEMFSTGFVVEPDKVAEPIDGDTLQWMKIMAKSFDAAVCGSVVVRETDGKFCNRCYFVKPDGDYSYYDKRHLFTYGGENKNYVQGNDRAIVEWRGMKFLLQICYDLRFPVFSRNAIKRDSTTEDYTPLYDCCIYVASWPDSRRKVWDTLLCARALENQCYVLGANRIGNDPACHYNGGTKGIDAYGKTLAEVPDNIPGCVTVELDMNSLQKFRSKFPVLMDAD